MSFILILISLVASYYLIGYIWICWLSYRCGAGFDMPSGFKSSQEDLALNLNLWWISMGCYLCINIQESYSVPSWLKKISPTSFYKKGKKDNDGDYQAEEHLLRESKK